MRVLWSSVVLLVLSSTANAQASLTGYVREDESLRGIQGVELSVDGSDKRTRTNKEGKYTLRDLPAGAVQIHVRFVGFAPIDTIMTLAADKPTENVFFLSKRAVALDTMVTTREKRLAGAGFESFEARRARGFGKFLDSITLRQSENRQLADLIRTNSLDVATPSTCHGDHLLWCDRRVAVTRRSGGTVCVAQVVMDGSVVGRGELIDAPDAPAGASRTVMDQYEKNKEREWGPTFDLNSISIGSLRGVEVYRSGPEAPDVYGGDSAGCGVVLLWTRR
jgi:hypothetical protein